MNQLRNDIIEKVGAFPDAIVAVAYKSTATNYMLLINEKERMHAASTMNVPVMIEVFKQSEQGKFALSDSLLVNNEFKSIMDGGLYSMDIGEDSDESIYSQLSQKMSIRDLNFQMISVAVI